MPRRRLVQSGTNLPGGWPAMMDCMFCVLGIFVILLAVSIIRPVTEAVPPTLPDLAIVCQAQSNAQDPSMIEVVGPEQPSRIGDTSLIEQSVRRLRVEFDLQLVRIFAFVGTETGQCGQDVITAIADLRWELDKHSGAADDTGSNNLAMLVSYAPMRADQPKVTGLLSILRDAKQGER